MRFMIIVKNTPQTENAEPPPSLFEDMGKYNQALADAGVLLTAEGLTGSRDGAIVTYKTGGQFVVKDGPFTEAKELIAGFWILQLKSLGEAVEWVKRMPGFVDGEHVEIRRVGEMSDFEGVMPEHTFGQEQAVHDKLASKGN